MFANWKTALRVSHTVSLIALGMILASYGLAQTSAARAAAEGSRKFKEAAKRASSSIDRYAERLDKTDKALARLARSDRDLASRYRSFSDDLKHLQKAETNAADDIQKMLKSGADYFAAWDRADSQIADPELRRASAARRSEILGKYGTLADRLSEAANELPEMMNRLHDLNLFFGAEITPENISRASDEIKACRKQTEVLRSRIADVQRTIKEFQNGGR